MSQNGTPVNFAFAGTNTFGAPLAGFLIQTTDHSAEADKEDVRNAVGDIVTHSWYDQHLKASLEFVITGTGIANAQTLTTVAGLVPGTFITITACTSNPDLVATTWEVVSGASIKGSNTTAKRVTVPLEKRAGITAVAGA